MKKGVSQKLLKWRTSDIVKNIVVYVINILIICALFVGKVYLNFSSADKGSVKDYFSDFKYPLQYFILITLIVLLMAMYFFFEDRDFLKDAKNSIMIFSILEISVCICFLLRHYVNDYFSPLALVAVLTLFLDKRRNAIFVDIIFCIIMLLSDLFTTKAGTVVDINSYSSFILGFSSGLIAIFTMNNVYSRLNLLLKGFLLAIPTVLCIAIPVLGYQEVDIIPSIISAVCSGPLSIALFIVLLPFFELIFKKVSAFRLAELTDHKSKLIKRLIQEAPGTFSHAIVVSNISEACAIAIEEDALLARTCAYYHDIGKLRHPEYFGENQLSAESMHDDLTPELSTNIIKSHTIDGYQLALKNGLPKVIADACREHHGTLPILYFYNKAKKYTDGEVDINQFCYLGPKPQTKINAIIMIADASEAAARALKDRSREKVRDVVKKIVDDRLEFGQFDECEITIRELEIITNTVVNTLTGVYHKRVVYPKLNLEKLKSEVKEDNSEEEKEG